MKRLLPVLAALAALAACGKGKEPPAPPPPVSSSPPAPPAISETPAPPPPLPRPLKTPPPRDRTPKSPNLVLLVNGQQSDPVIVRGWPLVVRLEISAPDAKTWTLSTGGEAWSRRVKLSTPWPLDLVSEGADKVALAGGHGESLSWTLPSEKSLALVAGPAAVEAVLTCPPGQPGEWTGTVTVRPAKVRVIDPPSKLPAGWSDRKVEVEAEFARLRDGDAAALARVDQAVAADKANWRLLWLRGDLLVKLDRGAEGAQALDQAVEAWTKRYPKGCVPDELVERRSEVLRALLEKAVKK